MVALVPTLLRQELARLAENDARIDGRGRWEARDITLETDCCTTAKGQQRSFGEIQSSMLVLNLK